MGLSSPTRYLVINITLQQIVLCPSYCVLFTEITGKKQNSEISLIPEVSRTSVGLILLHMPGSFFFFFKLKNVDTFLNHFLFFMIRNKDI